MNKRLLLLWINCVLLVGALQAQHKWDAVWLLGYDTSAAVWGGGTRLDFNQYPPVVGFETRRQDFHVANTSICDRNGNLVFYSNGCHIFDKTRDIMLEGDTLSTGYLAGVWCKNIKQGGSPVAQSVLALPGFGSENDFFLLNYKIKNISGDSFANVSPIQLLLNRIDLSQNNGLGKVIEKHTVLVNDTLGNGYLQAVRHANGRDWWIVAPVFKSNCYEIMLLTPFGIQQAHQQCLGNVFGVFDNLGQAVFSPDGAHYVRFNSAYGAQIFEFDRCNGSFSPLLGITTLVDPDHINGAAFSLNSRFLYLTTATKIYQYDLWATDIEASQVLVGEWDGIYTPYENTFYMCQLGPDGKIYIGGQGTHNYLHIIELPDEPGTACTVHLRAITLASLSKWALPNFAFYRLGPLDNSGCDSLGLNNVPVAAWRHDKETANPLAVDFFDLSYFEPQTWQWDFGDGSAGSSEQHPYHVFTQEGSYEICLTVTNSNGSDTYCRTIPLGTVHTADTRDRNAVSVNPNPFGDQLIVTMNQLPLGGVFSMYNGTGQRVLTTTIQNGINEINTVAVPAGFYHWQLKSNGEIIHSGKCIKSL